MTAPLSYTSQFGYYGLRVNPTFDQVIGTIRKPLRIPLPTRSAKWYALSPYRGLILDAEAKYNDYEHARLDYRQSGAELPEHAAQTHESAAGGDARFDVLDRQHQQHEANNAYDTAKALQQSEQQRHTAEARTSHLRQTYGANRMDPTVEAAHEELTEAGVPHAMPVPRIAPNRTSFPAPPQEFVAAGQPQAAEFPPFEHLSMGQPARVTQGHLSPSENLTYERARDFVVEPTWSS